MLYFFPDFRHNSYLNFPSNLSRIYPKYIFHNYSGALDINTSHDVDIPKSKNQKCFFVMKSALFEKANVAVNTKLTSDALFVWKFQCFFKQFGQKRAISVWYDGEIFLPPPRCQNFSLEKFLSALFTIQKCLWKPMPPPPIFWCFLRPWQFSIVLQLKISLFSVL